MYNKLLVGNLPPVSQPAGFSETLHDQQPQHANSNGAGHNQPFKGKFVFLQFVFLQFVFLFLQY